MVTPPLKNDSKDRILAAEAQRRWRIIQPLIAEKRNHVDAVAAAAEKLGVGVAQTYKLIAACRANPTPETLKRPPPGPKKNFSRLDPAVDEVIEEQIKTVYLTPERPSLQILCEISGKYVSTRN